MSEIECIVKRPFFHRGSGRTVVPGDRLRLNPHEAKALDRKFVLIMSRGMRGPEANKMVETAFDK